MMTGLDKTCFQNVGAGRKLQDVRTMFNVALKRGINSLVLYSAVYVLPRPIVIVV